MRYLLTFLIFIPFILEAQLVVQSLENNRYHTAGRIEETQVDTTLTLPFWDDFSTSSNQPDIYKWATGKDIFVNETYGINPPTYKVATFDGLTQQGRAHRPNSSFPGPADSLVSHPIDLSQLTAFEKNTVYLSFFWQAFGNGELPDPEDSLNLEFYSVDSTWVTVWSTNGGLDKSETYFQQVIVQVSGDQYLHQNFRFRFRSIINRGGPFDTWHIDYVYLNKLRSSTDIFHFDRSLSSPPSLLFAPYAEVPASQFFVNPAAYLSPQNILASNLDNTPHPLDYYYNLNNLTTGESYVNASLGNAGGGALLPLEQRMLGGPDFPAIPINNLDSQVLETTYYYNTGDKFLFEEVVEDDTVFLPVDLKVNDTIRHTYTLHNYYAYDDGIAEYSAGVNVDKGKLVVMFTVAEQDTLTHIDFHFPDINPNNPAGKPVNIVAYSRLTEDPARSQPYSIQLPAEANTFTRVKLNTPLIVRDTFYIGYENNTNFLIGVGLDRNNLAASDFIFYNVDQEWIQNDEVSGALMIRPVFIDGSEFILSTPKYSGEISIYPNPTNGIIHVPEFDEAAIYDLSGSLLKRLDHSPGINLSEFPNGIYILKMRRGEHFVSRKVILSR